MKYFKLLHLRDKTFFEKKGNGYSILGNPISLSKKFSKSYDGLYIIDLNLVTGKLTNFDVYDKLSYLTHIQVDAKRDLNEREVNKLFSINCRITFYSPPNFKINKNFSAYFAKNSEIPDIFNDVVVEKEELAKELINNKRVFFIGKTSLNVFCKII